jgi:hypothetical protein
LTEELKSLCFIKNIFSVLKVEKVAHFSIFHNHINIRVICESVPDLDDMGMIHFAVEFYLSLD